MIFHFFRPHQDSDGRKALRTQDFRMESSIVGVFDFHCGAGSCPASCTFLDTPFACAHRLCFFSRTNSINQLHHSSLSSSFLSSASESETSFSSFLLRKSGFGLFPPPTPQFSPDRRNDHRSRITLGTRRPQSQRAALPIFA